MTLSSLWPEVNPEAQFNKTTGMRGERRGGAASKGRVLEEEFKWENLYGRVHVQHSGVGLTVGLLEDCFLLPYTKQLH